MSNDYVCPVGVPDDKLYQKVFWQFKVFILYTIFIHPVSICSYRNYLCLFGLKHVTIQKTTTHIYTTAALKLFAARDASNFKINSPDPHSAVLHYMVKVM